MIRREEVELVFLDDDPAVVVRVRGVDVAMVVLPGIELPQADLYDGYWERPDGPDGGVSEEGEFLVVSWRNGPSDGPLEEFARPHRAGRWDRELGQRMNARQQLEPSRHG
jgi:hypothetical protein